MTDNTFWGREINLLAGEEGKQGVLVTEQLRVEACIRKTLKKDPNHSTIKIYNLTRETSDKLTKPNTRIILHAGYTQQGGAVMIASGEVLQGVRYKSGVDVITEIEIGDGFIPIRDTLVSISYQAGTSAKSVLSGIARQMNLVLRKMPEVQDKPYTEGFAYMGQAFRGLDRVCAYLGAEWSIQNNELQIIKRGGTAKKYGVVLRSSNGMIGSPEMSVRTFSEKRAIEQGVKQGERVIVVESESSKKDKLRVYGYNVSSYLLPTIEAGDLVQLDTQSVKGWFRVDELEHKIDSRGGDFRTDLMLTAVTNG